MHSHNQCSGGRCGLSMRSVQDATARSGTWLGAPDCWPPSALLLLLLLLLYGRYCRVRELFALPRLVFVRSYGACARSRCVGAATLLGGAYDVSAAAAGFAAVVAMPRADLSTTEAIAARVSCLLCRGLFSCGPAVFVHDYDAWVQRHCSCGAYDVSAAAAGFAAVVTMPRA